MTTLMKNKVINELENFPDNKIDSLLDYISYLKNENKNKKVIKLSNDLDSGLLEKKIHAIVKKIGKKSIGGNSVEDVKKERE
jgi:hypothetical protein